MKTGVNAPHPEWIVPDWPAPARVRALVTTRAGGVSEGAHASLNLGTNTDDDPANVARNRAIVSTYLSAEPKWLRQVHGTKVVEAERIEAGVEADGAVAHTRGQVLAVLTADCLPVLFCDRDAQAIGIAHAGWRGLAAGVIENTVRTMRVNAGEIVAYLGPGIGPAVYEVGAEVREAFVLADTRAVDAFSPRPGGNKYLANLYTLARQRLLCLGVEEIHGGGFCTFSDERFFSFRRERNTGRMASLIWIENE